MRKTFKEYNQNEQYLFPPSLHDWLPEDHLAYFISEIVEEMDLSEIYKEYREEPGQPPYSPLMMVKVWLYAFSQGIRSSRRVEKALHEDIGFRVISGNQYPDHRKPKKNRRKGKRKQRKKAVILNQEKILKMQNQKIKPREILLIVSQG